MLLTAVVIVFPPLISGHGFEIKRFWELQRWTVSSRIQAIPDRDFAFDFFDALAEGNAAAPDYNMLRAAYREGADSLPNEVANRKIGPGFVEFLLQAVESYRAEYQQSTLVTR